MNTTTKKTRRIVAGIATAALTFGMGGFALSQASAAPPADRPYGQASAAQLGTGELSDAERATLLVMVDEERMARDLYEVLGDKYPDANQFENIADSEQRHYDSMGLLLQRYGLSDPAAGRASGSYADADLQSLYTSLVATGGKSLADAYQVGITIETKDIADLKDAIAATTAADAKQVFTNLLNGSQRHLSAFTAAKDGKILGAQNGQGMQNGRRGGQAAGTQAGQGLGQGRGMGQGRGANVERPADCPLR